MARYLKVDTTGLSSDKVMEAVETEIELSSKDEDGGTDYLTGMIDIITAQGDNVKSEPKSESHKKDKAKDIPSTWRKDFKISGQIGDCSSCLSYMSFLRQVTSGQAKGFTEEELKDGIIRAIAPSSGLRGYLEGCSDLTLSRIQTIVRTFYKERSATELYSELCSLTQTAKETPQEFVFRALELRQKIYFADRENTIKYDQKLVAEQFNKGLVTGIRDDRIRVELSPILDTYTMDEELLQAVNDITRKLTDRDEKLKKSNARVTSVEAPEAASAALLAEIKALRVEVAELKKKASSDQAATSTSDAPVDQKPGKSRRRRGICKRCQEKNASQCDHCFACFETGHRKGDPKCAKSKLEN
ncbi:MAG: hypothetical protein MJA29_02335 [Candidatus Omnitrophica bacterium]|nr:hypothetical protein [Candidatus Omnitrophota bacterium]